MERFVLRYVPEVPFLLFSFRESDEQFWRQVFDLDPNHDLYSVLRPVQDDVSRLIAAGLGFIWQLARQNPYSLRLLCGASVHWCEQICERTLIQILNFAAANHQLLVLRLESKTELWQKLLECGVHHQLEIRRAAHISVLQTLLTQPERIGSTVWVSAARRTKIPRMRVADADDD